MAQNDMTPTIRVDESADKETIQTRIDRAVAVENANATSPLYKTDAHVKTTADDLVAAGKSLSASDVKVRNDAGVLKTSQRARQTMRSRYDKKHALYCAAVEGGAALPEDVTAAALPLLTVTTVGLLAAIGIDAKQDGRDLVILVHVKYPKGTRAKMRVALEISPDPATEASFVKVVGDGVKRSVPVAAPGKYLLRAATVVAGDQGGWVGPVAVTVK